MIANELDLRAKSHWVWRETLGVHLRLPEARIASSLSPVEYGGLVRFDPAHPLAEKRDRCIISKGHGLLWMYPILTDLGFFYPKRTRRNIPRGKPKHDYI